MSPLPEKANGPILGRTKRLLRDDPSGIKAVNYLDQKVRSGKLTEDEADYIFEEADKAVYPPEEFPAELTPYVD